MKLQRSLKNFFNAPRRNAFKKYSKMALGHEGDFPFHIENLWEFSGLTAEVNRATQNLSAGSVRSCGTYYLMMAAVGGCLQVPRFREDPPHRALLEAISALLDTISELEASRIVSIKTFDMIHLAATLLSQQRFIAVGSLPVHLRELYTVSGFRVMLGVDVIRHATKVVKLLRDGLEAAPA